MLAELGWAQYEKEGSRVLTMPETTLGALAKSIKDRMKIKAMRVVGDPRLKVSRVALSPGYNDPRGGMRALSNEQVDVLVVGESREWEVYEYAQDAVAAGMKKGLIVMGHSVSEDGGMKECAKWMRGFVTEVPVDHVPTGEPFWPV
jgi:putative NIF3 family GTP cyclohydrolase 1 type 2